MIASFEGSTVTVFANKITTTGYFNNLDYIASFQSSYTLATGKGPTSVQLADIDNDGQLDIVVLNQTDNTVSVIRNHNSFTGTIASVAFFDKVDFPVGKGGQYLKVADLDGDGKADIVVTNTTDNTFSILRNTSAVDNFSFETKFDLACGTAPSGMPWPIWMAINR